MILRTKFYDEVLFCFSLLFFFQHQAIGANIYVTPGGTGDGSIATPTDLQSGLDMARTNLEVDTIFLQQGTYDASTAGASTFEYGTTSNDNMAVTLQGGWDSGFTSQSNDPALTVLDGGNNAPVLHILADVTGVSFDFTLNTLTIQNGMATSSNGGGILAYTGVVPTSGSLNLTVSNCLVQNNSATATTYNGGGIFSNGSLEVYDSTFSSNSARSGGAIYIQDVPGGDYSLSPLVQNSTFDGNSTVGGWQGSAIFNSVALTVKDSAFVNSIGSGSTIYSHTYSSMDISNSKFAGNQIDWWGSALQFWDSGGTVTNCLFYDNVAGILGSGYGAITYYDSAGGPGPANITILNSSFIANQSPSTGYAAIHNRGANMEIYNSIFWNNEGTSGIYNQYGTSSISYSDVHNLVYGGFSNGGNNINSDPLFVNTTGLSTAWDLHLSSGSLCIDAGSNSAPNLPTDDIEGNPRLWDGDRDGTDTVDMGAYEFGTVGTGTVILQVTTTSDNDCSDYNCDLQSALNGSASVAGINKEIRVAQGTYTGNFTYFPVAGNNGKLTILGGWSNDFALRTLDPGNTILDANNTGGRVLTLNNRSNNTTGSFKVEGLTLKNGIAVSDQPGGGLLVGTYSPGTIEINNNIIENNEAGRSGGGIVAFTEDESAQTGGSITVSGNIIRNNLACTDSTLSGGGGGAFVRGAGNLLITNNLIHNNEIGTDTIDGTGGGLYLSTYAGDVFVINNTIVTNRASTEAGGAYLTEAPAAWATVDFQIFNNIIGSNPDCVPCREDIINNISDTNPSAGNSLTVSYNNYNELISTAGSVTPVETANFAGDPMFVSESAGKEDYHLTQQSLCIDAGTNSAPNMPLMDIEGNLRPQDGNKDGTATANMGCYETVVASAFPWTMFLPAIISSGP